MMTIKIIFKEKVYFFLFVMGLLINVSCNQSNNKVSNMDKFHDKDTLAPVVHYIDEATKQIDLVEMDNFYIIQNDVDAHQNQLDVYDNKTFKYLYGFAVKGHGNNEIMALDILQTPNGDTLEVIDQSKYKIVKYKITKNGAKIVNDLFLKLPTMGPLQEIYRQNDSIVIFSTLDRVLQTFNTRTNKAIFTYNVCDSLGIDIEHQNEADFHFVLHKNQLALGFRHINSLLLGKIDGQGRILIPKIKAIKQNIGAADTERYYYSYIDMNDKYIMAQYMGYKPSFVPKVANIKMFNPQFELEIYKSDMSPYKHIVPKSDILRCKLAKHGAKILSWDYMKPNGNIMLFNFSK